MSLAVLPPSADHYLSRWVEQTHSLTAYDPRIEQILCPLIAVGGRVIDVGAGIGDHTVAYAARVGPTGIVWAIEPYEQVLPCLRHNTADAPQVRIVPVAVGAVVGKAMLMDSPWNPGVTAIAPMAITAPTPLTVHLTTLDTLIEGPVDYLKVDVEGYELEVFHGARRLIQAWHPIIVLELHRFGVRRYGHTDGDVLAWMAAEGYALERLPEAPYLTRGTETTSDWIARWTGGEGSSMARQFVTRPAREEETHDGDHGE